MSNKQNRTLILEDLVNAQQELIMIYMEVMDAVDSADQAIATTMDPYDETIIGKDLHDLREKHIEREAELAAEIARYFDKLEGKEPEKEKETTDETR